MKSIVIGTSLSGKTTLIRYIRANYDFNVSEIDEELTSMNDGQYPMDADYKHQVLVPKIIQNILKQDILFFTNTDYFTIDDLRVAKEKGFKIIQLTLPIEILLKRNQKRMLHEGYADHSEYLPGMLEYQQKIYESGIVDEVIDDDNIEKITKLLIS